MEKSYRKALFVAQDVDLTFTAESLLQLTEHAVAEFERFAVEWPGYSSGLCCVMSEEWKKLGYFGHDCPVYTFMERFTEFGFFFYEEEGSPYALMHKTGSEIPDPVERCEFRATLAAFLHAIIEDCEKASSR